MAMVAFSKPLTKNTRLQKFEYLEQESDDDLLIGLESSKYDIGTKGAWYTERTCKEIYHSKEASEIASIIGFTVRKERYE